MHRNLAAMLAIAIFTSGCDATLPLTPAQKKFEAEHAGKTVTPHGLIVSGSVRAVVGDPEAVQYQTADGKWWVTRRLPDGTWDSVSDSQVNAP